MSKRGHIAADVRRAVLIEAGYRCAVPTCRNLLIVDLHHIVHVEAGGDDTTENLIALCPNCHAMHHRGDVTAEAIRVWKRTLESLSQAFDQRSITLLLALDGVIPKDMGFTWDTFLEFAELMSAKLVTWDGQYSRSEYLSQRCVRYALTDHGRRFVEDWKAGKRQALDLLGS